MNQTIIRENDKVFLEVIFQEIRKINEKVLFEVLYFPSSLRVQIQSDESFRGRIFNKLYHLHKIYNLKFNPSQFIRRDKTLITFDLRVS